MAARPRANRAYQDAVAGWKEIATRQLTAEELQRRSVVYAARAHQGSTRGRQKAPPEVAFMCPYPASQRRSGRNQHATHTHCKLCGIRAVFRALPVSKTTDDSASAKSSGRATTTGSGARTSTATATAACGEAEHIPTRADVSDEIIQRALTPVMEAQADLGRQLRELAACTAAVRDQLVSQQREAGEQATRLMEHETVLSQVVEAMQRISAASVPPGPPTNPGPQRFDMSGPSELSVEDMESELGGEAERGR